MQLQNKTAAQAINMLAAFVTEKVYLQSLLEFESESPKRMFCTLCFFTLISFDVLLKHFLPSYLQFGVLVCLFCTLVSLLFGIGGWLRFNWLLRGLLLG